MPDVGTARKPSTFASARSTSMPIEPALVNFSAFPTRLNQRVDNDNRHPARHRRARKTYLIQFLVEATVLSLLGGLIGIALGPDLVGAAAYSRSIPFAPSIVIIILAVGFSTLIGMVFGFFPVLRGARLNPIDALRHE
jgi:hypothetical protein